MLNIFLSRALRRWRQFTLIAAPLVLLPLLLIQFTPETKCAYVVLLVAIYWVSSAVPLAVASLLPLVLFPLFGILSSDRVCQSYMKESNVVLLAGVMAAIAIENSNLHRRIALKILLFAGTSPKWLMLSFMSTTAFLSMWINNTSATSLMVPIVESILQELPSGLENECEKQVNDTRTVKSSNNNTDVAQVETPLDAIYVIEPTDEELKTVKQHPIITDKLDRYRKCTLLSVAYASSFGGSATVTGSGPNLVLMEALDTKYKGAETGLTFATWMLFAVPVAALCLILTWLWLQIVFLGPRSLCKSTDQESSTRAKNVIRRQYQELGTINFHQLIISVLFILLVLLWVFRQPEFMPGWSSIFKHSFIKDSVAGVGIVFLMFALPSQLDFFCCYFSRDEPPPRALTWPIVQQKMPWGILLLMGGGFALADGAKASGLSKWLGAQLTVLSSLSPAIIVTILVVTSGLLTEVASNTATATILMPVLGDMADSIRVHPIYLMLPSTIACSFAFMLPIATPPNAIVSEVSGMSNTEMMKPGIVSNIICLSVVILLINTLGVSLFNLNEYPSWATQRINFNTSVA